MSRGATTSEGSSGENIQHFSTIRIRATGSGLLKLAAIPLDDDAKKYKFLVGLPLAPVNRIQPNRIVNYIGQRVAFQMFTVDLDAHFRLNRIVVYMKEIYTSHPGA